MITFIAGCVLGCLLSLPPGPVAAHILQSTVLYGKRVGIYVASGVAFIDMMFCAFVVFASTVIMNLLRIETHEFGYVFMLTKITIAVGIILYGLYQLVFVPSPVLATIPSTPQKVLTEYQPESSVSHITANYQPKKMNVRPLIIGLITALSNAINPTFLPALLTSTTLVRTSLPQSGYSVIDSLLFVGGFGAGTFLWFYGLVATIVRFHKIISPHIIKRIQQGSAVVMIGFGVYLALQLIK